MAGGGSYTVSASKSGYALSAAHSFTNLAANQTASFTATLPFSINGGSNSAEVAPSTNVSMAFNLYDQAGANDIGWAQFYLADSSGNAYCMGDWGRPNGLDLYDGNTGATFGFGINASDSFCTVSLASITNSVSDPTQVTVVLNFNFIPGPGGTYTVLTQINYGSGYAGPWQALGTLIIDPGSTLTPTSGAGFSQTFTASFLDTNGATDIAQARLLIQANAASSPANQCIVRYDPAPNNLYLLGDDGVTYLGPITGGGYDTLANSQCAVTGASNVQIAGTALQVDFSVVFTTNFAGSHTVSLSVLNNEGTMAIPTIVGSWNVPIPPGNSTGGTTSGPGAPPDPILPTPDPQPPSPVTSPQVQDCTDVTGSWTYVAPGGIPVNLALVQTSAAVTGNVTLNWPSCTPVSWQVSTGVSALGVASFAATNQQVQWCQIGGQIYESATTINFTLLPSTLSCRVGTISESDIYPTATNPFDAQSVPGRTSSGGPYPISRSSDPPGLMLTSDIVNDRLFVTLSDASKTADLQVRLSNASFTFGYQGRQPDVVLVNQSGVSGSPNAYQFPIGRLNLPAYTQYGSMIATWGSLTVTVAPGFATLGSTRFSQYNTPTESKCGTVTSPAFVFHSDGTCTWTQAELNPKFMEQVDINGTGTASNSYPMSAAQNANILKPWFATSLMNKKGEFQCGVPQVTLPDGSTLTANLTKKPDSNVFVAVKSVTGRAIHNWPTEPAWRSTPARRPTPAGSVRRIQPTTTKSSSSAATTIISQPRLYKTNVRLAWGTFALATLVTLTHIRLRSDVWRTIPRSRTCQVLTL